MIFKRILPPADIFQAVEFLRAYPKPIAFSTCPISFGSDESTDEYRTIPLDIVSNLVKFWSGAGYSVLHFVPDEEKNAPDLGLKAFRVTGFSCLQRSACYHVIGKMIAPDGDEMMDMVSVGGKSVVLVPPDNYELDYSYSDWHFTSDQLREDSKRLRYIQFKDWMKCMNTNLFNEMERT